MELVNVSLSRFAEYDSYIATFIALNKQAHRYSQFITGSTAYRGGMVNTFVNPYHIAVGSDLDIVVGCNFRPYNKMDFSMFFDVMEEQEDSNDYDFDKESTVNYKSDADLSRMFNGRSDIKLNLIIFNDFEKFMIWYYATRFITDLACYDEYTTRIMTDKQYRVNMFKHYVDSFETSRNNCEGSFPIIRTN